MAARMMARPARPPITPPTIAPVWLVAVGVFMDGDTDEDILECGKVVVWNRVCSPAESRVLFGLLGSQHTSDNVFRKLQVLLLSVILHD